MISNFALLFHAIAKAALLTGLGPALILMMLAEFPYVYRWARYLGMPVLDGMRKGERCRVLIRGKRNSCLIEFPDGMQAITSRNALKRCGGSHGR